MFTKHQGIAIIAKIECKYNNKTPVSAIPNLKRGENVVRFWARDERETFPARHNEPFS
jgi:hypothetical protein